jgi:hypothetical protein
VTAPKAELEQFLKDHGPVVVAGDSPAGPIYELEDGTTVAVPMAGDDFFYSLPDVLSP